MTYQFARQLSFWVDSEGKTENSNRYDMMKNAYNQLESFTE